MQKRNLAALAVTFGLVVASPTGADTLLASGAYPEGLLVQGQSVMFAEMGADVVSRIDGQGLQVFWRDTGCGPTSITTFGEGYLVNCHLRREMVEVSKAGATLRRFAYSSSGKRLQDPNASAPDGAGGAFFSDSGIFSVRAPATGEVFHIDPSGTIASVLQSIKYANGVAFDADKRILYVSEHLARRILAVDLDRQFRPLSTRVFVDFAAHDTLKNHSYSEAGPDGLALGDGVLAAAEYGSGRIHIFGLQGDVRNTIKVRMSFVTTVAFGPDGTLYVGGPFQNSQPPFEGAVVRFSRAEWQGP